MLLETLTSNSESIKVVVGNDVLHKIGISQNKTPSRVIILYDPDTDYWAIKHAPNRGYKLNCVTEGSHCATMRYSLKSGNKGLASNGETLPRHLEADPDSITYYTGVRMVSFKLAEEKS